MGDSSDPKRMQSRITWGGMLAPIKMCAINAWKFCKTAFDANAYLLALAACRLVSHMNLLASGLYIMSHQQPTMMMPF